MKHKRIIYRSLDIKATKTIATFFAKKIIGEKKCVIFLEGDLGSGKTTFVRFLIESILGDVFEGSPSFTIINEYPRNIYHIDLYRLHSKESLLTTGVSDYLNREDGIFFIEWPKFINQHCDIRIKFFIKGMNKRLIYVEQLH